MIETDRLVVEPSRSDRAVHRIFAMAAIVARVGREGSTTISGNVLCGSKWRSSFRQRVVVVNRSTIP